MKNRIRRYFAMFLVTILMMGVFTISAGATSPAPVPVPPKSEPTFCTYEDIFGVPEPVPPEPPTSKPIGCTWEDIHGIPTGVTGEPPTMDSASTVTPNGIQVILAPNDHFYWAEIVLDETPIVRVDSATGNRYLCFQLAKVSRLDYLYQYRWEAFHLETYLRDAERLTLSQDVIWDKSGWDMSIGEQLSEAAQAHIKASSMSALEAMQYVQGLPEYLSNNKLRSQIDYRLDCFFAVTLKEIGTGLDMLRGAANPPSLREYSGAEFVQKARAFMDEHPELKALDEVVKAATSMPTSRFISIQSLGEERVNELYAGVEAVAKVYWPSDLYNLEGYGIMIPLANGDPSWLNLDVAMEKK